MAVLMLSDDGVVLTAKAVQCHALKSQAVGKERRGGGGVGEGGRKGKERRQQGIGINYKQTNVMLKYLTAR